ncbi:uncharacterized protein LOC135220928 [Macrobrachium nipponense]|uniref:uncharacterized protein LOC135220928 n=1 Tax=Macrobrachium nipponense TaxID=159736 RepID=UPI0030C8036D
MNGIISHQNLGHQVGLGLADLVTKGSGACHLFVVSSGGNSILLDALRRFMQDHNRCFTIVTLNYNFEKSTSFVKETKLLKEVLMKSSCWSIVLDLTHEGSFVIRFLQSSSLSHHSAVPVIMVGPSSAIKTNLIGNDTFRNCLRALYLAVSDRVLKTMLAKPLFGKKDSHDSTSGQTIEASTAKIGYENEVLKVFQRCLFCEGGNAGLRLLYQWRFAEEPPQHVAFRDESRDFNGHQFNVVGLKRMPLVNLERKWEGPVGTVKPLDSVGIRMAEIFRQKFNFSYLLREPPDGNWGLLQPSGNFTGIVGTLQHERADFTFMLNSLPERMVAMDASRTYTDDPFIIISPMPAPLPRSLAIVRPFEGWLWACVIASCFFSGVILWLLQKGWAQISKEKGMGFAHSMIYVSRMLLEDPDSGRLESISSQMLIGWWSVGCLIILFSYQSGLIAHLTVVKNQRAIDSLEDILAREGWTWGRVEYTGATYIFLSENPSRVWQEIFAKMEVLPDEVQLDKVLQGGYSLISRKFWALPDILRIKRLGLPVHRGTTEYQVFNGYSWGFRKGFPVLSTLDKIQQRLLEAGLIDLWMDQITEIMARDPSSAKPVNLELRKRESLENQGSQDARVLTTEHLQGAFFLMFIGYGISVVAMSIELLHYATASTV